MGEMSAETIQLVIVVGVLVVQVVTQWIWVKHELKQLRKDSERMDKDIEMKREANVEKLREIYDMKIVDSRAYAKGLFDQQGSEIKSISNRMSGIEVQLQRIIDLLVKK